MGYGNDLGNECHSRIYLQNDLSNALTYLNILHFNFIKEESILDSCKMIIKLFNFKSSTKHNPVLNLGRG
ncbi:hypothetical protein EXW35_28790 (plasmid) [Bacillus mycoides]|nr:hypothetical protein EXW35_28790 [Bacillus mycoides]